MLRQIEWKVQNAPITKDGVLPVTTLFFFENFVSEYEPLLKSWLDVPTTQMYIFILFVGAGVSLASKFPILNDLKHLKVFYKN